MSQEFQNQQPHRSPQMQQQPIQQQPQQPPRQQPQQQSQQQPQQPQQPQQQPQQQPIGQSQQSGLSQPPQQPTQQMGGGGQPIQQMGQQPTTQQMGGQQPQQQQQQQPTAQFEDHFTDELRILLEDFGDVTHVTEWCAVQCVRGGPELADCARICEDIAELAELNEKLIARDSMFGPEVADLFIRVATEGVPELQRHQQRHPHVMETIATIERTINSCQAVLQTVGQGQMGQQTGQMGQEMGQQTGQMGQEMGQQTGQQMGGQRQQPTQQMGQQPAQGMGTQPY